jgi:sugar-specific transcriptional regulator TrmB
MITQDDGINLLTQLGLTTRQAQVYITLAQTGQATAKTIAKTLQTDRAEVYRAITELEKTGITQRILTSPITFKASPISEAFKILLKQNAEKHSQIQAKTERFIQKFQENNQENTNQEEHKYSLMRRPEDALNDAIKGVKYAQTSIDAILKTTLFKSSILTQSEVLKEAIKRGVKFRYIVHLPQSEKIPLIVHTYDKNGFSIKHSPTPPQTTLIITDKKEAMVIIVKKASREKAPRQVLHSNDPNVVATFQDYFELKWSSAQEIEHKTKLNRQLVSTL